MSSNPYAAPKASVADAAVPAQGNFVPGGRGVAAGRGWDWIVGGWNLFKKQPGTWIGLIIVALIIFLIMAIIPFIGSLALMVLGPVFGGGILLGCRALDEGGELELGHLFAGFREKLGTLAAVGALYLVASVVIALVVGLVFGAGMFALFAGSGGEPGAGAAAGALLGSLLMMLVMLALMLPVIMAIWFAPSLVVFNDRGAVDAMKESFAGCLKNIVPFLLYGIVMLVASVIAAIPLGLGWLVLGPVFAGSIYASYCDIYYS